MPLTFVLRRLLLITLLVVPQVYWLGIAWHFGGRLRHVYRWLIRVFVLALIATMMAVLYDAIAAKFLPAPVSLRIAPPVQLWIFSSTFAFFLTKGLRALVWCERRLEKLLRCRDGEQVLDTSRRRVLRQTASLAGGAPFAAAFYGYAVERFQFAIERVEITIARLPAALDGLRIAQLSDIHIGDLMPLHELRRAVALANGLEPHLAVITGDFLTRAGDPLAECIHELGHLRAPLGAWGCNGNHEIYADAEAEAAALFQANGMRLLRDGAVQIEWNKARLNLIGIDYQHSLPTEGKTLPTLKGAERLVRRDMPNILLSHNPDTFASAAAAGVDLTLSGHTHGGQINIQLPHTAINPARVLTNFIAGLYQLPLRGDAGSHAYLYVNRGLGTLGLPARIGARPEITLLTLRSGLSQLS